MRDPGGHLGGRGRGGGCRAGGPQEEPRPRLVPRPRRRPGQVPPRDRRQGTPGAPRRFRAQVNGLCIKFFLTMYNRNDEDIVPAYKKW